MKKAIAARSPIGIFAFSGSGDLLYYKIWNPKTAVDSFLSKQIDREFLAGLSGYEVEENTLAYRFLRKNFRDYAKNLSGMSDKQLNSFLSGFSVALSTRRLQGSIGRDRLIVQAIRS